MRNPGWGGGVWCVCLCLYVPVCVCACHVRQEHTGLLVDGPGETANRGGHCAWDSGTGHEVELLEPGFLHGLALAWALLFGSQPSPGRRAGVVSTGKALRLGGGHGTVPAGHLQR